MYELCSRSQAAATNQHTNAQRRGEFCFIESGLFDLYSDTIPTLRTAAQKAVSNARTTKNGTQEPIIGGGVCSWSHKNLSLATKGRFFNGTTQNFIAKPAKNCKISRFLAFWGWNRRISTRRGLQARLPLPGATLCKGTNSRCKMGLFVPFRRV